MSFSWTNQFGQFGSAGGGKQPAAKDQLIQQLENGVVPDTVNDVNDTLVPIQLTHAKYGRNACLLFDGVDTSSCSSLPYSGGDTYGVWARIDSAGATGLRVMFSFGLSLGRIYTRDDTGTFFLAGEDTLVSVAPYIDAWHYYEIDTSGDDVVAFRIDDSEVWTGSATGSSDAGNANLCMGARRSGGTLGLNFVGWMCGFHINGKMAYPMAETIDEFVNATNYDTYSPIGSKHHASINSSNLALTRTASSFAPPWNIDRGFTKVGTTTIIRVPADSNSPSLDALGNSITNHGGYAHNDAESTRTQTDTIFTTNTTRWHNGSAFVAQSFADDKAHLSSQYNEWLGWVSINGVCHLRRDYQYDFAWVPTDDELAKNRKYFTQGACGAGFYGFVPLIDDVGNVLVDDEGNVLGYYP